MRVAALRRRGWQDWGVVEADRADTADLRYSLAATQETVATEPAVTIVPAGSAAPHAAQATLGLVSYPQRP
jgi:hypothetical protein